MHLIDRHQVRHVRGHHIALLDIEVARAAVERRAEGSITELHSVIFHGSLACRNRSATAPKRRFVGADCRRSCFSAGPELLGLLLRDETALEQLGIASRLRLRVLLLRDVPGVHRLHLGKLRFVSGNIGFCLVELRLYQPRIYGEEQVPLPHIIPFLEGNLGQFPAYLRFDGDRQIGLDIANHVEVHRHVFLNHSLHGDRHAAATISSPGTGGTARTALPQPAERQKDWKAEAPNLPATMDSFPRCL